MDAEPRSCPLPSPDFVLSELDQVECRQDAAGKLLQPAARGQRSEINRGEPHFLENGAHVRLRGTSFPDKNITRRPPACLGSADRTASSNVFAAFTTLAPGASEATISLDVLPSRSARRNPGWTTGLVASMRMRPFHAGKPERAARTCCHGTASTTTSASAASSRVPPLAREPSSFTTRSE